MTTRFNQKQIFSFGENWKSFLPAIDERRILLAEKSLQTMLGMTDLRGKTFLDVGCGSGLFSVAARRLGARVHSFDSDPVSVECTELLKRRYYAEDAQWTVRRGSILDSDYVRSLGQWDVVYSWGVLHHTGALWQALENVSSLVVRGGLLYLAIYNDQGFKSQVWREVKRVYNALPSNLRWLVLGPALVRLWGPTMVRDVLIGKPFHSWRHYAQTGARGMSAWRDVVDWVGGYPFEVAEPEAIFTFYRDRGFVLRQLKTCGGGLGCNEFVLQLARHRTAPSLAAIDFDNRV